MSDPDTWVDEQGRAHPAGERLNALARLAANAAASTGERARARVEVVRAIRAAERDAGGVRTRAAELLGVSRARYYELRSLATE